MSKRFRAQFDDTGNRITNLKFSTHFDDAVQLEACGLQHSGREMHGHTHG